MYVCTRIFIAVLLLCALPAWGQKVIDRQMEIHRDRGLMADWRLGAAPLDGSSLGRDLYLSAWYSCATEYVAGVWPTLECKGNVRVRTRGERLGTILHSQKALPFFVVGQNWQKLYMPTESQNLHALEKSDDPKVYLEGAENVHYRLRDYKWFMEQSMEKAILDAEPQVMKERRAILYGLAIGLPGLMIVLYILFKLFRSFSSWRKERM